MAILSKNTTIGGSKPHTLANLPLKVVDNELIFNGNKVMLTFSKRLRKEENLNDFDEVKHAGVYIQPLSANATMENNYPVQLAGTLVVLDCIPVVQIYYTYNRSSMYIRGKYKDNFSDNFSDWEQMANKKDLDEISKALDVRVKELETKMEALKAEVGEDVKLKLEEQKKSIDKLEKEKQDNLEFVGDTDGKVVKEGAYGVGRVTKVNLSFLFGSPPNGMYYTTDTDAKFLDKTPENRSVAYVTAETFDKNHTKLTWTYSTQSKQTYTIMKDKGVWQKPVKVIVDSDITSSLGTSTTLVASQKLVNDVSTRTTTAQNMADSAYSRAGKMWNIVDATGYAPSGSADDFKAGQGGYVRLPTNANVPKTGLDVITKAQYGSNDLLQIAFPQRTVNELHMRTKSSGGWGDWFEFYHTANTTTDSSGFLRASGNENALVASKNLKDVANVSTARSNLGLGNSAIRNMTSELGTSTTLVASQRLVNDVSTRTTTAQNRADSAYNLANSKWSPQETTGTGNIARMSEVNSKITGGSVVQSTGTSTTNVMSQKAVTDQLNSVGVKKYSVDYSGVGTWKNITGKVKHILFKFNKYENSSKNFISVGLEIIDPVGLVLKDSTIKVAHNDDNGIYVIYITLLPDCSLRIYEWNTRYISPEQSTEWY